LKTVTYIAKIALVCCLLSIGTAGAYAAELQALLITHLSPDDVDSSRVAARVGGLLTPHGFTWKAVNYKDYTYEKYSDKFALYVVCGSSISIPQESLTEEFRLMKESSKPVIGICYGFEQMIRAFGGKISRLPEKLYGIRQINLKQPFPFPGLESYRQLRVFESHRWRVKKVPENLILLGWSDDPYCVEIVTHSTLPRLGIQFHPELKQKETQGRLVLNAFFQKYFSER